MGFADYVLKNYGFQPDKEARVTCLWDDIALNCDSATGTTYFDISEYVLIDNKSYTIKGKFPIGLSRINMVMATLEEKK